MCYQETRLHAICNHAAVDRIECSEKCAHFDTIEIQLSTYCQSCRQQVDNTAILNSVLRWKLGPCPARRRKTRPAKRNALGVSPAPGTAKPSRRPARKLSGAKSLSALMEAASAPPTRELPPTPKRLNDSASVENLAVSLGGLGLASPTFNRPGLRYSLDLAPLPPTQGQTPRAEDLKSPRPPLQHVPEEPRPWSVLVARDADTDTITDTIADTTTDSTRPSTATTTSTMTTSTMTTSTMATATTTSTRKSALVQHTAAPLQPPPPPPQQQHQAAQQSPGVSASVPRSLWSLRRSKSSARILALASTRDYMHAKFCGSAGPPSPSTPDKNLFPAPQQQQQQKKPIDIHDPEWLAKHGLKWDARGLGLVSAAV
ncbi:hypothetical protein UCDDA912_g05197 [Diaporthe ampelina]|uniref:Uncharacterized protein n=1 Tax=Diaporthe ampelina TaxID=1214573 RepID=A0A0G2I4M0_9PEZI|nr:hypothetical protein UCDDA912_g05197 [Diaporthe ampelina]